MKVYIDATTGKIGNPSDLIIVDTDDKDDQFLNQASVEEIKDWLDMIMGEPAWANDACYLTAMLESL
jgi:hypothetical protein